ncbi:MAG: acyltransferase [Endomicrobiaceae bacterium]|nr:acyltransferase [Endomicrobiaceae bacterium]
MLLVNTRNNNFDFLRFVAAFIVLLWHSFICFENKGPDFFTYIPGGVPIFFVISGFLITKSWVDNPEILSFLKKRILRIFPALIIVVCFVALLLGPAVTTVSLDKYFTNSMFFDYFKNIFLYEIYHTLPGVFQETPYTGSVNASLWTLPLEFFMYILVAVFGIARLLYKKWFYPIFIIMSIVLFFLFTTNNIVDYRYIKLLRLLIIFFISSFFYINNQKIILSIPLFVTAIIFWLISVNTAFFEYVQFFTLPYIVIFIAYSKIPYINKFGKYGDFSYGIYLWAFPIQQTLIYLFPNKYNIYEYIVLSFIASLFCGIISYYLIEKPALKLKKLQNNFFYYKLKKVIINDYKKN